MQLEKRNVRLIDIYGVIGTQTINTLEHLGVAYDWSIYSPTKKAEILEAERAKDEKRDIMSRMIGAEIRYSRLGYWVRQAPLGFKNERVETIHGKRTILVAHNTEAMWVIKMFELRAHGTLTDQQTVNEVNNLGFRTRVQYLRDKNNRMQILGKKGGGSLTTKMLWKYIRNPIYAGINLDAWTKGAPPKARFDGLVSIEIFNQANRGKIKITEEGLGIKIDRLTFPQVRKGVSNPDYPYKKVVLCPICEGALCGSASRGRSGQYYPAYHCSRNGHYFRVPKGSFDKTIESFVKRVRLKSIYVEAFTQEIIKAWKLRAKESERDREDVDQRITELEAQVPILADKIKYVESEFSIRYLEAEILKVEKQILGLKEVKNQASQKDLPSTNLDKLAKRYANYYKNHLDELLLTAEDPFLKAHHFAILFDQLPKYTDLISYKAPLSELFTLSRRG